MKNTSPNCCYFCDFLSCEYNGSKRKGKSRPRHCAIYKQSVKSKAYKSKLKNREVSYDRTKI